MLGIQKGGVDAIQVHVGDAGMRVEATLAALRIFHGVVDHGAVARAYTADGADAFFAAEDFLLDHQPLLAVGVERSIVAHGRGMSGSM